MPAVEQSHAVAYTVRRIARHVRWARAEGLRRLVEEDRLNPVERATTAWAKRRWRRAHGVRPGQATPVYVVGLQRSGTNMLMRGLDAAPQFQVYNENDRRVFHRFQLRSDDVLGAAIRASRHAYVMVKPLCESHRVDELLALPGLPPGRALWVWRDVDDRARSEVAKFGSSNLDALRAIADGTIGARWQGQRLDAESRALVGGFDYAAMSPHTAAALFWYIRNDLFFRLGLHRRDDVLLCSYDALVADPEAVTRRVCAFLGVPFDARLCAHVERRAGRPGPTASEAGAAPVRHRLELDPRVRALCDELTERLAAHA